LIKAAAYVSRESGSDEVGERLIRRFLRAFRRIAGSPEMGRPRPELRQRLRSHPMPPYLIFYKTGHDHITVVRLVHERQNLAKIFRPRRK
jgi:toxin ParE1/3/4